jgi:phosphoenolpyruvate-protein kinase (PTS system EI component)
MIRTLDIGGDKPAPYLPLPHEANPFPGLAGDPHLAGHARTSSRAQLRALMRAAVDGNVHIMFPMIEHR